MSRPDIQTKASSAPKTKPFAAWRAKRDQKKAEIIEKAAKMITNKTAQNEKLLVDTLKSISISRSKLPKEYLERRSRPDQILGDFEMSIMYLCQEIEDNPFNVTMDIRPIDERLLALAMELSEAVEQGDETTAEGAKAALFRGVTDIRNRAYTVNSSLAKEYIKQNAEYLDNWITYVASARSVDAQKRDLVQGKRDCETQRSAVREAEDEFVKIIRDGDSQEAEDFRAIYNRDLPEHRSEWTDSQREIQKKMIQLYLDKSLMNTRLTKYDMQGQELMMAVHTLKTMYTALNTVPIVQDANLINKQNEIIDNMLESLAKTDVLIDETFTRIENIDAQVAALDDSPATIKARKTAIKQAKDLVDEIKKQQDVEIGKRAEEISDWRKKMGILSDEEIKIKKTEVMEELESEKELDESYESALAYN